MKKRWKYSKRSVWKGVFVASMAILFFVSLKSVSLAEATGKVRRSVNVRKSADGSSEIIGSSSPGTKVSIISQTNDASGNTWYEVYVDANTTGYIRSDLIDVDASSGTIATKTDAVVIDTAAQSSMAPGAEIPPETGMDAQYATIKVQSGKSATIRSGASTSKSQVASLPDNTQVIVSGQTEGSDKTWYYITFTDSSGAEKTGYVRSDLVSLGEMVPVEEPEEQPQEQQPEAEEPETGAPVENNDYELVYAPETDEGGDYVWWIYDKTAGDVVYKQRLDAVLAAAHAQSQNDELDAATVAKQRIVIIVLIAVIIVMAVAITIMIFKLRDAYYETYEDDEDEEEEEEEEEPRRRREDRRREERGREERGREERGREERGREERGREERGREDARKESRGREERRKEDRRRDDERGEEPVRRRSAPREERQTATRRRTSESDRRMPAREVTYEDEMEAPVKAAPKKKTKNFLIDDDDFEFEFLNMKNKDRDI